MSQLSSKDVDYIIEDNELKIGKFLPKVGIEIKSVNELNKMDKVCIIIFAWNFTNDIIFKLRKYNKNFIILKPLPKFELIKL